MIAAAEPVQRPADARLLYVRRTGALEHRPRAALASLLLPGDLVVANDAATLPASLTGVHVRTGRSIEVRLAGRRTLDSHAVREFTVVVFGAGDFHTRTEDRPPPPPLQPGDELQLGPLRATVLALQDHPRLARTRFEGPPRRIWEGLARHGKPVQYAHLRQALALWDVWSPFAGVPSAFEPASAGFAVDWALLESLRRRGIEFTTLTHTAGLSSTGDPQLDSRLPFDEPFRIPLTTAAAIQRARRSARRIVAVGTTVVRALEQAATDGRGRVRAGEGLATGRIGASSGLQVVDLLLSGTHAAGTSHHEMLRAFVCPSTLERIDAQLDQRRYRTHEYGDSVLIERAREDQNVAGT